ncbi:F0F1 ATP synthase subunit B [Kaistia dalseonensis]|uniref:ATP synthase subunit b n=1 Tax=Kaistia dalseonensis TaxID=410840 RepID=A0ABU0HCS6_9HYPH|nr:F0F1 ATP synthase subunit B [Kaistia dalseonensis]MCX5497485.1 F0F1 ATP synthase subunit B [Kaistia dalseonensis]MDQ0440124.1 F-type H+-transporting ATPase subunit b [Kaistia dalseonensis]
MTWFVTSANAQEATPAPAAPAAEPAPAAPAAATPAADAHAATPAATHSAVGAPEGHKGPFPPFDTHTFASQIFWFVICFGALYLLMKRVIVPRIGAIVDGRAAKIAGDIDEAQRLRAQSDDALAAYEKALAQARASAQAIAQTATDEAKTAAAAKQHDVEAALSAKLEAAEARIGEIKKTALADVGAIAHETASAVVHALIGQEPSSDEVASAVSSVTAK